MRGTLLLVWFGAWAAGCAQNSLGSGGSNGTSGGSNGTAGTGGTSGGSNGGSTGSPSCQGTHTPGPSFTCTSSVAGAQVVAGQAAEIDCSSSQSNLDWNVAVSLGGATIQNNLSSAQHNVYVTFPSASLALGFADTQVTVTVSAADCSTSSVQTDHTIQFTLIGNLLATDALNETIDAYTSDGNLRGNFLGPGVLNSPNMVALLNDGTVLAGGKIDATHPALVHLDAQGNLLAAWDATDHSNLPLWNTNLTPYAAAQDSSGTVWVTAPYYGGTNGLVHRFSSSGSYQDDAPIPTDLPNGSSSEYSPKGVALLPGGSGDMVVADAAHDQPYLVRFPSGGGTPTHVPLDFELCDDPGAPGTPTCAASQYYGFGPVNAVVPLSNTLLVTIDNEDVGEAMVGQFDTSLRFLLATAEPGTGTNDRGYTNLEFPSLAVSGDIYIASPSYGGCLLSVDPRTLYDPNPNAQDATCWSVGNAEVGAESIVHLGP